MAAKLVSMKMTAKEQKAQYEPGLAMKEDAPRYPYGLSLSLDKTALKKLGVDELPAPGESYLVVAKVEVTNVSSNAGAHGDNKSMTLQITEMCLEDSSDKKDAAKTLYDGDE
jgi:hypothetical protein